MVEKFAHDQRVGASNRCIIEATDADEHAHNLRDWQQQYDQISGGAFYGRIDEVRLDALHTFREHTSQSVRQQCNVWPDAIWIGFAADEKNCRINGQIVDHNEVMIRPGSTQFELITPEQFDIFGMVVNQQALLNVADKQGVELDSHFTAPRRRWQANKLNQLRSVLTQMLRPEHAGKAGLLQQDLLLMTMLDVLHDADEQHDSLPSFARRKVVVEKVIEFLRLNQHNPITITQLCELVHVSRRTLQYCFEDILGISPLQYIRISRLNGVRRDLLNGLVEGDTIAMVAERWGFWHAGQFTHDYTQLFGENPSVTLRRHVKR